MSKKKTLTATQVAKTCGVTSRTVQRWIHAGHFPGARKEPGKTSPYHIPRDEVEAFVKRLSQEMEEQQALAEGDPDIAQLVKQLGQPAQRAVATAMMEVLQQTEAPRKGTPFALIVEDDPDAGYIFEATLKAGGFATDVVGSSDAALKRLESMVPDVLVLDLHLPDAPGTEVLRHIRANPQLAQVPIIIATAHAELAKEIEDEVDLVLIKPVRYSVLQDKAVELTHKE